MEIIEAITRFLINRDNIVDDYDIYDILPEDVIEEYDIISRKILQIDRVPYNDWLDNITLFLYNLDAVKYNREIMTEACSHNFNEHFYDAENLCGIIIKTLDKPNPMSTLPKECPYEVLCYDGSWHKIVFQNVHFYISNYAGWLVIDELIGWRPCAK